MRISSDASSSHPGDRLESGLERPADLPATTQPGTDAGGGAGQIPGCLWKHSKTGGWYWTVKSDLIPRDRRGKGRFSKIPLVAKGGRPVATKNKAIAARCRQRLWREWRATTNRVGPRGIEEWLTEFWEYNALHASVEHANYNCLVVRRMIAHAGGQVSRCQDIGPEHVQRYLAAMRDDGMATRTIQAHRNTLHKFCKFLFRRGVLDTNPADLVEVAAPAQTPPRYLDDLQRMATLKHISEQAQDWMFAAVCVALYAGPRLGSLMALQCQHVQPAALVLPLPKVGHYSIVPLDDPIIGPELGQMLTRQLRGRTGSVPLFPVHNRRTWGELLARLTRPLPVFGELPGCRAGNQWHLLRATWAVNCARRGATLWQLMEWGGWRVPTTVMRYVNIARAAHPLSCGCW